MLPGSLVSPVSPVMLDKSRIQGFGSDSLENEEKASSGGYSFFDAIRERVTTPGMQSAIDSVSMRFGDAVEAVQEDMSEMAHEFKAFVSTATGMQPSTEEDEQPEPAKEIADPRQKAEAVSIISKFSQSYKAARVSPLVKEMNDVWAPCSLLGKNAIASALYEHLSWSSGDLEWQPRLRILYLLEFLYWKGGDAKDISVGILHHAEGLLKHLATEVPQTKEKALQVIETLQGKQSEPPAHLEETDQSPSSSPEKTAKAEKKAAPMQDLLDVQSSPSASSSSAVATANASAKAAPSAPVDLLSIGETVPAAPPVVDLIDLMSVPAPTAAPVPPAPAATNVLTTSAQPTIDQFNPDAPMPGLLTPNRSPNTPLASAPVVNLNSSSPSPLPAFCSNCGAAFGANAQFCGQCGARRVPEAMPSSPAIGSTFPIQSSSFPAPSGIMAPAGYSGSGAMFPPRQSSFPMGGGQPMGVGANHPRAMDSMRPTGASPPLPITNGASSGAVPWRGSTPYIPSAVEVQNMPSVAPADPFSFAEKVFQDFAAGK